MEAHEESLCPRGFCVVMKAIHFHYQKAETATLRFMSFMNIMAVNDEEFANDDPSSEPSGVGAGTRINIILSFLTG